MALDLPQDVGKGCTRYQQLMVLELHLQTFQVRAAEGCWVIWVMLVKDVVLWQLCSPPFCFSGTFSSERWEHSWKPPSQGGLWGFSLFPYDLIFSKIMRWITSQTYRFQQTWEKFQLGPFLFLRRTLLSLMTPYSRISLCFLGEYATYASEFEDFILLKYFLWIYAQPFLPIFFLVFVFL